MVGGHKPMNIAFPITINSLIVRPIKTIKSVEIIVDSSMISKFCILLSFAVYIIDKTKYGWGPQTNEYSL